MQSYQKEELHHFSVLLKNGRARSIKMINKFVFKNRKATLFLIFLSVNFTEVCRNIHRIFEPKKVLIASQIRQELKRNYQRYSTQKSYVHDSEKLAVKFFYGAVMYETTRILRLANMIRKTDFSLDFLKRDRIPRWARSTIF